ncbi:MAG: hypothetical protein AUG49_17610 [Catenulispora sp. 13_1_20CM_3_70_7]|nr:MAG: hypothetical protein AUG49_17610 [Catenulispora sp. 13_1_20CM_3_70_7]
MPVTSALAASASSGPTARVAPNRSAASCLLRTGSMATISAAPAMRAPWITAMPTPPAPITATEEPGCTRAVLNTAPTPVVTPQPSSAPTSNGTSSGIFTAHCQGTTISSAKVPLPAKP